MSHALTRYLFILSVLLLGLLGSDARARAGYGPAHTVKTLKASEQTRRHAGRSAELSSVPVHPAWVAPAQQEHMRLVSIFGVEEEDQARSLKKQPEKDRGADGCLFPRGSSGSHAGRHLPFYGDFAFASTQRFIVFRVFRI